jgi:hypothetical protein
MNIIHLTLTAKLEHNSSPLVTRSLEDDDIAYVELDIESSMESAAITWLAEIGLSWVCAWRGRSDPALFVIRARGSKRAARGLVEMTNRPIWVKSVEVPNITW